MLLEEMFTPMRLLIVCPTQSENLNEAIKATVGNYTARRDPPHFQGDSYHAHADIPGGYEVAWDKSGNRRHGGKFPAVIPNDARLAVAKVLGVDASILEGYDYFDEIIGEKVLLIEVKDAQGK